MSKQINIGGRLHSTEQGNVITGANEVLDDTKGKKQNVINSETDAELLRLDQSKQNNLTFDNTPTENSTNPVTSGGVYAANITLHELIEAILVLIPSAASALNQLADKAFVNSSVSTATATFRGTYNVVTDLELAYDATHEQIATKLGQVIATADNNDYAFVQVPVSATSMDIRRTERYKFNGTVWGYEYDLNTSGFTAAQWEAINSAITDALVQKLSALPTAQELAAALLGKQDVLTFDNVPTIDSNNPVKSGGVKSAINDEKVARENADIGLGNRITAIENVIPSAASSSNKLVDNSAMSDAIGVVTTLISQMDATFNLTTTDGHITLHVTQENGVITSVQVQSSDIASAAALTLVVNDLSALITRVGTAEGNITSLTGRMTTAEGDIETLQDLYNALQQSAPQVIEPTDTWPVANPSNTVIYRVIDRVNTPPEYYSDYMWNGTSMTLMATYNNAIDTTPKKDSANLITSGGVFANIGAFDVSEYHKSGGTLATYADLSAALSAIPTDYQKGGMSIKFVQSSDNKYVQYRLMSQTFSTTESDWQGVDEEPTAVSDNLVKSGGLYPMYQEVSGAEMVFPSDTSSYHAYPISLTANKTYLIKNTTGSYCTLRDSNDQVIFEIHESWTDYHEVIFTQEQADSIVVIRNIIGDGSINIKMKTFGERINENKQAIEALDEKTDTLVPIKIGNNLITDIEKGKFINPSGEVVSGEARLGVTNKIYLNGNKRLYNNAFVEDIGVRNALYAADGTIVATFNSNIIDATSYPTAVYAICTVSVSNPNVPVRQQVVYGDRPQPYSPVSPIQGMQIEYVEVTCNSDVSSGADFVGNSAVRDAIAAITDASYFKRYILKCTGVFKAVKPTDYQLGPDSMSVQYALFWLKDYIYIDGIERNRCIFYSYLPDTIAECQLDDPTFGNTNNTYGEYQPLFLSVYPAIIKNATFIAHNTRYALHCCNGNPQPQQYSTITLENCSFVHEGKYGDSIGTIGGPACGFGAANGSTYLLKNCIMKAKTTPFGAHDNSINYDGSSIIMDGCTIIIENDSKIAVQLETFCNTIGYKLTIVNTKVEKGWFLKLHALARDNATCEFANTLHIDANFDFEATPLDIGSDDRGLCVEGLSDNSSVRFNTSSSAFETIVGNLSDNILQDCNTYNMSQQYGYMWKYGGTNLKGYAIGLRNLNSAINRGLGVRLGDCSSSNKSLGIIINGTEYTVTFNRNYTSVSNADIIAEINAVIGSVATASLCNVNEYWYPNFKGLEWQKVDDAGSIKRGMGVVYTETGVRKAKSTDGYIDGIAVDNGVNGSQIRIVTGGVINFEYYVHPLLTTAEHYWDVPYNIGYDIGTNDGEFVRSESNVVLRKDYGDSIRFV